MIAPSDVRALLTASADWTGVFGTTLIEQDTGENELTKAQLSYGSDGLAEPVALVAMNDANPALGLPMWGVRQRCMVWTYADVNASDCYDTLAQGSLYARQALHQKQTAGGSAYLWWERSVAARTSDSLPACIVAGEGYVIQYQPEV